MDFRTRFHPDPIAQKIKRGERILFAGSCFAENISSRLQVYTFNCLYDPLGIVYNPVSLAKHLEMFLQNKEISPDELFFFHGTYRHWQVHSRLSAPDKHKTLSDMRNAIAEGHIFLQHTDVLILTFGTAIAYMHKENNVLVGNNHKVAGNAFDRVFLSVETCISAWQECIQRLQELRPNMRILCTVSPVRHLKEGTIDNTRSKAVLHLLCKALTEQYDHVSYFPAYELLMDDLRDYRFYAEDMVHPNSTAIDYIFSAFAEACIDSAFHPVMQKLDAIHAAMQHKAFHPDSEEHKAFKQRMLNTVQKLAEEYPDMALDSALHYFMD
ncbi:MAG: GSCFA domain-containing protein [Chitinophagales bacterium]